MDNEYRLKIAEQVSVLSEIPVENCLEAVEVAKDLKKGDFAVQLGRLNKFKKLSQAPPALAADWASKFQINEYIKQASASGPFINILVNKTYALKKVVQDVIRMKEKYGTTEEGQGKNVIVEYSSPNIAKPFHAGHLRSTIIGNFLVNLHRALGYNVIGLNYLGDWGKQYGLLAVGYKKHGNDEQLEKDAIKHLFEVYVAVNKDAEANPSIHDEARAYFKRMEEGDEEALAMWKKFRDLSIATYKKVYARLSVEFDVYSGESQQSEGMIQQVKLLHQMGLISNLEDGAEVVNLQEWNLSKSLIKKKDGTTLYITRDIAAAVDRWEKYHFEKMFYVVGAAQDYHFQQLFKILELMKYDWVHKCKHINFGMVKGMSTRKGTAVFLEQILDTAHSEMLQIMEKNEAKFSEISDPEKVADIVGLSAVIVQDMSARRIKDYDFDWDRVLANEGHTGPYLQFAHARLSSMERKADTQLNFDANLDLITEPEALDLAVCISRYPNVIQSCSQQLESVPLVMYMFELSHFIGVCHKSLWVKGQAKDLAEARLLLYWAARVTLGNGMKLIGLNPLERM